MTKKPTLFSLLSDFARECPQSIHFGNADGWLTTAQVLDRVESTAWALRSLGVQKGDMVAMTTPRAMETAILVLALQNIGALAVLCDPRKSPEEYLSDCTVPIPFQYQISNEKTIRGLFDGKGMVFTDVKTGRETPLEILALPSHPCPEDPTVDPDGPGFLVFTSGSTGKRKAVMLSQSNTVATLHANGARAYFGPYDIALSLLPMDHIFCLYLTFSTIILRHAVYWPESADMETVLTTIERVGINRINGTPQLFLGLAAAKGSHDLSSLKTCLMGGAPCTLEQFQTIERELGIILCEVYGMSESTHISLTDWRDPQSVRAANSGRFCDETLGKILRPDGTEADIGEEGEICVDGATRMNGYYGDVASFRGLFHTGDLGYVDSQGYLHLTGRLKDIIIRNGNNLMPKRIEDAILSVPGVRAACVRGVEDKSCGEVPCAMVVAPGVSEDEIMTAIADILNKNELPAGILFAEEIPLLASRKPDKQTVTKILTAWKLGK